MESEAPKEGTGTPFDHLQAGSTTTVSRGFPGKNPELY